jgi:hypothetical protein
MKKTIFMLLLCSICCAADAQKKKTGEKVVEASEKLNKKSKVVVDVSNRVTDQSQQMGENVKNVTENVKKLIRVFEPIFKLHFKKKNRKENNEALAAGNTQTKQESNNGAIADSVPANAANAAYESPGVPENDDYNSDGTANWGNQYNAEYGCYLDALTGSILDGGTAEDRPNSVDLVYLAPNDGQNAYYLITPNFAHDNITADAYWGSATTDNPVKTWKDVNESEVAATTLTGAQFEKIQYNEQLRGAVKSAKGFASFFISSNKLDGKVFAVKTTMGSRDAFALIYVVKHVGTSGSGGHLKVKIKCTGFDSNGDAQPDAGLYTPRKE